MKRDTQRKKFGLVLLLLDANPPHSGRNQEHRMPFTNTVSDLLAQKRIPSLDSVQMSDLLQHLFRRSDNSERIKVAEVVYRHDHDHPSAMDIFLAGTLPLAERSAHRRAYKSFVNPSDWQLECMYDGAVTAAIEVFEHNSAVGTGSDAFRRYLLRALALGAVRSYFRREENASLRTFADLATVPTRTRSHRDQAEQDIITRDLLNQVTGFANLRPHVGATLKCIQALGPDQALKEHTFKGSSDPDKRKRERGRRPILNPNAIAQAMGTDRRSVHTNLREARIILRNTFNADGKLFLTH
jgi:hypothetical protein